MVIAAVDQRHLHRRAFQSQRGAQAAESAANDHHTMLAGHALPSSSISILRTADRPYGILTVARLMPLPDSLIEGSTPLTKSLTARLFLPDAPGGDCKSALATGAAAIGWSLSKEYGYVHFPGVRRSVPDADSCCTRCASSGVRQGVAACRSEKAASDCSRRPAKRCRGEEPVSRANRSTMSTTASPTHPAGQQARVAMKRAVKRIILMLDISLCLHGWVFSFWRSPMCGRATG